MGKKRKKVYNGKLLKVFEDKKVLPDGRVAKFEEVKHPGAALVIPFIGNKIVFLRQYRGVIGEYLWEFPAGKLDPKETPYACAKRELKEETGYEAKKIKRLGKIYTTPGFCDEVIYIYRAECGLNLSETNLDEDEFIEVKLFSLKQIRELFKNGKIIDSKSIAALAFAKIL
ncbi:MAG: NUDIX hydrolase [Candidatus Omnitrophica bacterium]|nr:NUDIX hydrolase [Candidatus Omnitrophota bacterium]